MSLPDTSNLAVCDDHGIMLHSRERDGQCPLCALDSDYEVRLDDEISAGMNVPEGRLTSQEIRQRIETEAMQELLPLLAHYLADYGAKTELWVTVAEVVDGDLPAGYTEAQERWANVVGFRRGGRISYITKEPGAKETIEKIREKGYGDEDDAPEDDE